MQITEQWILSHAPSPAVAEDGRALSASRSFTALHRTEDAKTYWAECAGSAVNPYHISIDWSLSGKDPIYSCSCPSRHFPCKHILGLMYEIMDDKPFTVARVPSYVIKARAKETAERAKAEARLQRMRKYGAAVKEKKLERQFEGLAKAEKMASDILASGVASISLLPSQSLERLAAELGNCDLVGARDAFERIAFLERQTRQDEAHKRQYRVEMLRILAALHVMIQRSRAFLEEVQTSGSYALEDPILYEPLGGVWNTDELREIGSYRKNAMLVQLSFDVSYDEAKRTYAERGFWLDLTQGDIVHTLGTYPVKTGRYSASDDSCFTLMEVSELFETPVLPCPRVWWDNAVPLPLTAEERESVLSFAYTRIDDAVNDAKEQLKEPLLPSVIPALIEVGSIGYADDTLALADRDGGRIALRDRHEDGEELASVHRLTALPVTPAEGDALFGLLFYDETERRICLHPYSLVTANEIIRLQF